MSGISDAFGAVVADSNKVNNETSTRDVMNMYASQSSSKAINDSIDTIKQLAGSIDNNARRMAGTVANRISQMNIYDALGYDNGVFDIPENRRVVEQILVNTADQAKRSFRDGILGSMAMANGKFAEGLALYDGARKQGESSISMMTRVGNQYKTLFDPNASEAEKAMARTNLGRSIGNRQELIQSIQSAGQVLTGLTAAEVSTQAASAQVVASTFGPLASLAGISAQQFGSLISSGDKDKVNLRDAVDALGALTNYDTNLRAKGGKDVEKTLLDNTGSVMDLTKFIKTQLGVESNIDPNTGSIVYRSKE